jgi:hypothetical protein
MQEASKSTKNAGVVFKSYLQPSKSANGAAAGEVGRSKRVLLFSVPPRRQYF